MIKVLSLHFTNECTRHCPNCYMRVKADGERKKDEFFLGLLPVAKELGIQQIALGGGEPSLFPDFVERFAKEAKKLSLIVNMTSNGDGITTDTISHFKGLTMISLSLDRYKVSSAKDVENLFTKMDLIKAAGLKVGCNLQLDTKLIENLHHISADIFEHADNLYLLQSKPSNIIVDEALKKRLLGVTLRFKNVLVDDSLQLGLGRKDSCSRGREIISIDHAGRAYYCSFDKNFMDLEQPSDLKKAVKEHYPIEPTQKCPFV